jgi:peptidylprolyl isomerase
MAEAIKAGDTITVNYTGKLDNGVVFDSSEGREPLKFTVGTGQLIKGFDQAVIDMTVGDKKTVTILPEDGYGPRNEDNIVELPRDTVPEDMELTIGMQLHLSDPNGNPVPAVVAEIGDDVIKMDINHMLAGKTIIFDIEIVETGLEPDAHACGCGTDSEGSCDSGCGCESGDGCDC